METIEESFSRAITYRDKGEFHEAIKILKEIIDRNPNHSKLSGVLTVLAGVYQDLEDQEKARLYYTKATELNPKSELASLGLYITLVNLVEYEKAIKELERYLIKYPANRYKITLNELLMDIEQGYLSDFKGLILKLAQKHNVHLGVG